MENNEQQQKQHAYDPEDELMFQEEESKIKSISKRSITFGNFKMHKKLAQGVKVVCKIENKKFADIVTSEPTQQLLIIHFGSGDEDDYEGISSFLKPFGQNTLHIFPGIPYGLVEFENVSQAENLIQTTTKLPDNIVANSCEINFGKKIRNVFFFYTPLAINQLERQKQTDIPNGTADVDLPGLKVIPDFVTLEEEQKIIQEADKNKWHPLAQRKVQHYGYEFIYGLNSVNREKYIGPLPDFTPGLIEKVNEVGRPINKADFDQLTLNDYYPGQGIPPHVDTHSPFEECLISLSLGSGVVMTFKNEKGQSKHIYLPPRSLAVFTAESRYAYYHSIASRKLDRVDGKLHFRRRRISLTFRRVKFDPCACKWPLFCDSQCSKPLPAFEEYKKETKEEENNQDGEEIEIKEEENKNEIDSTKLSDWEKKYVYKVYEKIAPHFSSTRHRPWPRIATFLNNLPYGSIVADVGCGNGKYLFVNQENLCMIGTDRSENLIQICRDRDSACQVFSADSLRLPFRTESVDHTISIAVIHHFSNKKLRIQAIKELARITRKEGKILIYVWAFEQDGRKFTQQDVLVPWNLQFKWENEKKISDFMSEKSEKGDTNSVQGEEDSQQREQKEVPQVKEEKENLEEKKVEANDDDEIEDGIVNEGKKTVVYKRYYHMFKHGELEDLVKEVTEVTIEESFYDHANWCVRLTKK